MGANLISFDQATLEEVQLLLLQGYVAASLVLKKLPRLGTIEIADQYLERASQMYRDAALNLDIDAERAKMIAMHWRIIYQCNERLARATSEMTDLNFTRFLTVIQGSERRISALLGLDAPQKLDLRLGAIIANLGPSADATNIEKLKAQADELVTRALSAARPQLDIATAYNKTSKPDEPEAAIVTYDQVVDVVNSNDGNNNNDDNDGNNG